LTPGGTGRHSGPVPLVLDLLRHGEALSASNGDDARRLSPGGERALERLALHLAGLGWRPDRAFTSPLLRARDTARIVLRRAAPDLVPAVMEALDPDSNVGDLLAALDAESVVAGHVLLVGHQPMLGELARRLTDGQDVGFAPGDLVSLEFSGGPAQGAGTIGRRVRREDLPPAGR
jgi:phosphohistidine phosphatase